MRIIIDGDIMAYMSACVEDTDLDKAVNRFEEHLDELTESLFGTRADVVAFVKGVDNFRDYYDDYKDNRGAGAEPPATLQGVRDHIARYGQTADGCEADDLCCIAAQDCLDTGEDYIICTIDKDLRQMHGKFFHLRRQVVEMVTEEEGLFFLHQQMLTGDSADNIHGLRGIGPKKSEKALRNIPEAGRPYVIAEMWAERYPDDWHERLTKVYNLVLMRRRKEDLRILDLPEEYSYGKETI